MAGADRPLFPGDQPLGDDEMQALGYGHGGGAWHLVDPDRKPDEQLFAAARSQGHKGVRTRDQGTGVELVRASTVEPERVEWAWKERIPLRTACVLAGLPGLGKSTITVELAARWSRGQQPGDLRGAPVSVLLATAEDSQATTIVPRLMSAGADLDRVHFIQVTREGIPEGLTLPDDIDSLAAKIQEVGARVLIVDPFAAHLSGRVNSWKEQDVRRAMAPLHRCADELGLAIVLVMHLKKGDEREVLHKIGGSGGVPAAARSVLFVGADPGDPEGSRILAHAKSNLGPEAPSLRYRLEGRSVDTADGETLSTSGIVWEGEAHEVTARDLLARGDEDRTAIDEATDFLWEKLAPGPRSYDDLVKEWGGSVMTLRRAKVRLRVESRKAGFGGGWVWMLPDPEEDLDRAEAPSSRSSEVFG